MSDTNLNPGAGPEQARTLERSASIKTQVVAMDVGGVDGPEQLLGPNVPMPTADATAQATLAAIQALSDTMLYFVTAMLDKMPRLDRTDRLSVDLTDYGVGGGTFSTSYVSGVNNPFTGAQFYRQFEPWNFSDAGSARIYQQIIVS